MHESDTENAPPASHRGDGQTLARDLEPGKQRSLLLYGAAAIFAGTLVAYIPALQAGFIWDDDAYVTRNPTLRSFGGLLSIWRHPTSIPQYYPLVHTTYWVEYHLWKLWPVGYHLNNVLLHALGATLLWRVLKHLAIPGAFVIAAVFALHPVQVESVAWVTERKNVLSGVFFLSSMLAFFRFHPLGADLSPTSDAGRWYRVAIGLFVAALLSKTVACSLPAVILLLMWWKQERVTLRNVRPLLPFFVVGLLFAAMTAWLEREHVGAVGDEWSLSPLQRCLVAGRALWFYAASFFWPHPLIFNYPRWDVDPEQLHQYIYPVAAVGLILVLWVTRRWLGRGALVAVLIFSGILVPALGFFNTYPMRYSFVADHFQYLACIGLSVLFLAAAANVLARYGRWGGWTAGVASVVLLGVLAALTWNQSRIYQDRPTLWRDTISKNPESWLALTGLGVELMRQGKYAEAAEKFKSAVLVNPDYVGARTNLGVVLYELGFQDEGFEHLEAALRIEPDAPKTLNNLAEYLARQGKMDRAVGLFQKAVRLEPNYVDAHYNLAKWLTEMGRHVEAAHHFREVLRIEPLATEAREALQRLRRSSGDTQ